MELETVVSLSKAEMLRDLIIEKLSTAAQEIFAVVERTVAGYEEEASGFRQEIDRQRRQLEVVVQPEIKVETTDDEQPFPICEPVQEEESGRGRQLSQDEEQHKYEPSVGFIFYTEEQMEEDEEVEESSEQPALVPTQDQDYLSELRHETASSLLPPMVQSDRRSAGRHRITEPQNHIDLRIRILEDSQIEVLSTNTFKKYPLHELQCPCGLQEADFLNLLRSTFPQLAARPFDAFVTDKTRKLQPLKVNTLTPEKISGIIKSTGAGHSALYIRLKAQEEPQATNKEFHPSQKKEAAADSPSIPDPTRPHTGLQAANGKGHWNKPQSHIDLKIRVLEDSQIDVLTVGAFKKYPLHELQCPGGLQEADFLNLLRSTFPQLAANKPFDVFIADKARKLQPLKVHKLTPEEISGIIRSKGTGNSTIYIRLKTQEEPQATDEALRPSQRREAAAAAADFSSVPVQTSPHTRLLLSRVWPSKMKRFRPWNSEIETHIGLRVRVLEDSKIDALSVSALRRFPLHELQCPCGLQERDFLTLLRSTFPQLGAEPFDFMVADKSRKLQPLKVNTLTPEEIYRAIRFTGAGNSSLYLRPKEEPQTTDFHPSQREAASDSDFPSFPVQTGPHTGLLLATIPPSKKKQDRSNSEPKSHIDLKIRVLEDSQIDVLNVHVFQKYPGKELQFPLGLQEADFLDRLRSAFPQLAGDKAFDFFTMGAKKRLQPLKVNTLTPEEIYMTLRSAGSSVLYIRLKPPAELQARKTYATQAAAAKDSPSTAYRTRMNTGYLSPRAQSERRKPGRPSIIETRNRVDLKIRLLEDSQINMVTTNVLRKYPVQQLQCPRGLQWTDFLGLLKSTFPQLAAEPFEMLTSNRYKRLCPLKEKEVTPEEIYWNLKSNRRSTLYIQLKRQEKAQASEEKHWQRNNAAKYSSSTSDEARLCVSVPVQQKQQKEVHRVGDSNTQRDTETDKDDDQEANSLWSLQSLLLSGSEKDADEASDRDDDWEPDNSDSHLRNSESVETTELRRTNRIKQTRLTDGSDAPLFCKVCRILRRSTKMLIRHAWSHVDDPERLCGVCGEDSKSAEELKSHLQSHLKTHSCNICGKSFLSMGGLKGHIARHKGKRPYQCKTCHKAFVDKSALNSHKWVHVVDKPHKCEVCQKTWVSKPKLKLHMASHHKKLYSCSTCRKPCHTAESLSQHILRHSDHIKALDGKYLCEICKKHFHTEKKLKLHLRNHNKEKPHVCAKCNKRFVSKTQLVTHMRVHTGQKPYKCSMCDKTFSQSHCVKRHMKTHQVERSLFIDGPYY